MTGSEDLNMGKIFNYTQSAILYIFHTMATLTKQERMQRDFDIVRQLKVSVNDIMAGDFPETAKPKIGQPVVVGNDISGQEWRLISHGSPGYENNDDVKRRFSYVEYGPFNSNGTWVLQSSKGKRNPVWTDPSMNHEGEGEYEQRHAVVLRCRVTGQYVFYFFQTKEDEIAAIEFTSGEKIASHYLNANRISPGRERGERKGVGYADMPAGYICCISDYIYFSDEGCKTRERFQQASGATYTTDFDRYCNQGDTTVFGPMSKAYIDQIAVALPHVAMSTDQRVVSAILSLEPRISPKKLSRILRPSTLAAYEIAYTAATTI
jgi:hypothetical protein